MVGMAERKLFYTFILGSSSVQSRYAEITPNLRYPNGGFTFRTVGLPAAE